MIPFDLAAPKTLADAVGLLDPDDASVRPLAGGTALMLMMKTGIFRPTRLVSLHAIEKRHSAIEAAPDGGLRIGALATLASVERAALVRERFRRASRRESRPRDHCDRYPHWADACGPASHG